MKIPIDRYLYDLKVQYALKIQPDNLQFGSRTLERYLKLFREKEFAHKIMDDVTGMINKESPPGHPIPEASLGVLRTASHALRAGRRFENQNQY